MNGVMASGECPGRHRRCPSWGEPGARPGALPLSFDCGAFSLKLPGLANCQPCNK